MELITEERAAALSHEWFAAGNAHDLFSSPIAVQLADTPAGVLSGNSVLREYFAGGLEAYPDPRSELAFPPGASSVALHYPAPAAR